MGVSSGKPHLSPVLGVSHREAVMECAGECVRGEGRERKRRENRAELIRQLEEVELAERKERSKVNDTDLHLLSLALCLNPRSQDTSLIRAPHLSGHLTYRDTSLIRTPHLSGHLTYQGTSSGHLIYHNTPLIRTLLQSYNRVVPLYIHVCPLVFYCCRFYVMPSQRGIVW